MFCLDDVAKVNCSPSYTFTRSSANTKWILRFALYFLIEGMHIDVYVQQKKKREVECTVHTVWFAK